VPDLSYNHCTDNAVKKCGCILTSVICKLFKSIIRDTMVHHLEEKLLIGNSQRGFRRGHSCLTNLLSFLDKVSSLVDSGNSIDVVFLDFVKAFDKVPPKRLLLKLESHGITSKVSQWLSEWLKEQMQRVCISCITSSWLDVLSGVPQGSVLGPILFLIYINNLDNGVKNWILKFADDTKIFSAVNNDLDRSVLQKDLDNLLRWAEEWQMLFNVLKCKVMHLGYKNHGYSYYMDGKQLDTAEEEKDLGIIISKDLKVSQQCKQAYAKASRMLGLINRSIKHKDRDILLSLYKSLVRPHLEYCIPAWSPHCVKDKELIERIQHRFTRMFPDLRRLPYLRRLQHLELWTLEERKVRADLIEIFKIIYRISSVSFDTFFKYNNYRATRGHSLKLTKKRASTDLRHHFFSERVINIWNSLDNRTVTSGSIDIFKGNLERLRQSKEIDLFVGN